MATEKKDFNEEDDDFEFGTKDLSTSKSEETKEDKEEEEKDETKKEEVESKSDEEKSDDDKSDEESSEDEKEDKEDKEEDKEKKEEKEEDLFVEKSESSDKKRTLKEIGKKFDLDLEKEDDDEEFEAKLSEKLSKSRQEVNLDGYSDDAKALIKHLNENDGDVESFFTNKNIISLQSVLSLDAETKVRNVRLNELQSEGKTKAVAIEIVDTELKEMSTREIKDEADNIDSQAKKLIQAEVKRMVGDKELKAVADREKQTLLAQQERTKLKSYIEKQDNFLGLKLSVEAKKNIIKDIDSGDFDKLLNTNQEEQKFATYMLGKHGSKILKKIDATISESNRKGFNAATKKAVDALHKTDDEAAAKKTGHQEGRKTTSSTKVSFKSEDID
jgi:hypothetical protein